jgi:hypothetical protein
MRKATLGSPSKGSFNEEDPYQNKSKISMSRNNLGVGNSKSFDMGADKSLLINNG